MKTATSNQRCLLEPVPEILHAQTLLEHAFECHKQGDHQAAGRAFSRADMPEIREWTECLWGKNSIVSDRVVTVENARIHLPRDQRIPIRMPSAKEQDVLISRDGYHCRFCGIPVIHKRIRAKVHQRYPNDVPWGRTNVSQHAAFQAMWLQFDHILPHSLGGNNSIDNIVITCAPCNYGRGNYTLEELGLISPLLTPPLQSNWNGLEEFRAS